MHLMRTLVKRSVVWLMLCGCSSPADSDTALLFQLRVENKEPDVVFLSERGASVWTLLDETLGTRGLRVYSRWRIEFPVSENVHFVAFDRIGRDGYGETVRFRADVDGVIAHYTKPGGDDEPVDFPSGGNQ